MTSKECALSGFIEDVHVRLEDIADQCSTSGGDAVWMARSILRGTGQYTWDDEDLCEEAAPQSSKNGIPLSSAFSINPNPVDQVATLWCTLPQGSTLQVVDMFGRTVFTETFEGMGHQLHTSALAIGTYLVRITHVDYPQAIQRLQVIH